MRPLRQLRRMDRRRIVHGSDAKGLQALRPAQHLAYHPRAFVGGLESIPPETRHVKENVWKMIFVWNNETITLGRIEPLDRSRNFKDINCGFLVALGKAFNMWRFFRPHAAFPPLHL